MDVRAWVCWLDQSSVEQRADILVYSSAPLAAPIEVTGPVTVTLYARSTAPDTDFTAKLVDVFPDGTAVNLANGIQRASFRASLTHPTPIRPGQFYEVLASITVWPTSNSSPRVSRIRLEILLPATIPSSPPTPTTASPSAAASARRPADPDHPVPRRAPVGRHPRQ